MDMVVVFHVHIHIVAEITLVKVKFLRPRDVIVLGGMLVLCLILPNLGKFGQTLLAAISQYCTHDPSLSGSAIPNIDQILSQQRSGDGASALFCFDP